MRAITKGPEPASLIAHRKTAECDYDNYADKDALRHALVMEQHGICCYCMRRIHNGPAAMKIEHWRCQSSYPDEQLTTAISSTRAVAEMGNGRISSIATRARATETLDGTLPIQHTALKRGFAMNWMAVSDPAKPTSTRSSMTSSI